MKTFLTDQEFLDASEGVPLDKITDVERAVLRETAAVAVEQHLGIPLAFASYVELHPWSPGDLSVEFFVYNQPLRDVQSMLLSTSLASDRQPQGIPILQNDVEVDRDTGSGQAQLLFVQMAQLPVFAQKIPKLRITYTAGYDDGSIQSDGISLEAPSWLKEATRIVASQIARRYIKNRRLKGMTDVQSIHLGDASIGMVRQMASRAKVETAMDPLARDLLQNVHETVWVGE